MKNQWLNQRAERSNVDHSFWLEIIRLETEWAHLAREAGFTEMEINQRLDGPLATFRDLIAGSPTFQKWISSQGDQQ